MPTSTTLASNNSPVDHSKVPKLSTKAHQNKIVGGVPSAVNRKKKAQEVIDFDEMEDDN